MASLRTSGIGARLAAYVTVFSVVVTLVVTVIQTAFEYRRETALLDARIADIQRISASALAAAVWVQDRAMAQTLIDGMARHEDVARIEVADDKGLYVASGAWPKIGGRESVFPLVFLYEGGIRNLGNVRVVVDSADFAARLRAHVVGTVAFQALIIALVAGFLLLTVRTLVTRHLAYIAGVLRRTSVRDRFVPLSLVRGKRHDDELDEVVDAMNRAGEQIHDAYVQLSSELGARRKAEGELRRAHREMERRVEERTAELAAANAELSAEIGRRETAERALRESERRARVLLDSIFIGAVLVTPTGLVRSANRAFAERLGGPGAELENRALADLLPGETSSLYQQRIAEVFRSGEGAEFEHAEGSRQLAVHMVPIEEGRLGGGLVAVFCRDVTLERQAEQLRDDVERITRHDLKGPIIGMLSGVQALRLDASLGKDVFDTLQLMEDAGYLALDLINRSLDLYRMEKGLYTRRADHVDVKPLVADVVRTLRDLASRRNVRVVVEDRGVGDACAVGERTLFFSMLANLVKNALEASPIGADVTIDLGWQDPELSIAIHNQGAVPEAVRDRLFEKYVSSGKHDGTGLGTYSARLIARTYGGDVTMVTGDAEGTTMTVRLPGVPAAGKIRQADAVG